MEINPNFSLGPIGRVHRVPAGSRESKVARDVVSLAGAEALNRSLQAAPDSRAEEVARAKDLIGQVDYPPRQTIQRISALLAINLGNEDA